MQVRVGKSGGQGMKLRTHHVYGLTLFVTGPPHRYTDTGSAEASRRSGSGCHCTHQSCERRRLSHSSHTFCEAIPRPLLLLFHTLISASQLTHKSVLVHDWFQLQLSPGCARFRETGKVSLVFEKAD